MPTSTGPQAFDERRRAYQDGGVATVLDFLMVAAENAGPSVEAPRWELKGEGAKYRNAGGQFCVIHLRADGVWVRPFHLPSTRDEYLADLTAAKFAFTRGETDGPWLFITNLREAVRSVPFMVRAYDERSA
jgi:hypothetical protein